ncbi:McrC family protein [Cyclonatronum proteinivorum]|uniref:McrC family protein n=1 Tax=Cyclonatronum proteinivorum TaxID=1457365 RepID=UPI0013E0A442|nr:restriction endonuclease [Cyclonatronum proteinivorum]
MFEHDRLLVREGSPLTKNTFEQLVLYHGANGTPYFSLLHKGVKFNQFVGVIQVGGTTIEVLPKPDRAGADKIVWRNVLISMLRTVTGIEAGVTSKSSLRLNRNSIFDLYIELFLNECERITHQGLSKKYRKVTENQTALRGRLHMPGQIRDNLIHKERFHAAYSTYDHNHILNQVLKETLRVLSLITIRTDLRSRVMRQQLCFDEVSDQRITEEKLRRIRLNRQTERYAEALAIARLILLNYHPDISKGNNHILALMFDMNQLWELFVVKVLKHHLSQRYRVMAQQSRVFWRSAQSRKRLKPDIILDPLDEQSGRIIIDTKWKTPTDSGPSDNDLRQIYAYNQLFGSSHGILLYPGSNTRVTGRFQTEKGQSCCTMLKVNVTDQSGNLLKGDVIGESLRMVMGCYTHNW